MRAGRRFRFGIGRRSFAAAGVRGTRPFAKNAKERGTHCGGDVSEFKGWATRPVSLGEVDQPFCYVSLPLLLNTIQRSFSRWSSIVNLTLAFSYWKSAMIDALQRLGFRHF